MVYQRKKGLTAIELAVVCVVIVVIASCAAFITQNYLKSMKIADAEANIKLLGAAHTAYFYHQGTFASDTVLVNNNYIVPGKMWNGAQMIDPWGNPLAESVSGSTLTIQLSATSQALAGRNISVVVQ